MDIDISPEALRERWDGAVRAIVATSYFGYDFECLVQAGHEGVLKARRRYFESSEPPPNTPFEKAVWWYIRNAVEFAASKERPRLRRPRIDEARHDACEEQLEQYTAHPNTHDAVAATADVLGRIAAAALVEYHVDPELFVCDEPTPDVLVERQRARIRVAAAVGFLETSERRVVEARYLDDLTFEQIAARLGFAERWVRELHQRALRRLKETLAEQRTDQRRVL